MKTKLFAAIGLLLPFLGWTNDSLLPQENKYEVEVDHSMTTIELTREANFTFVDEDIDNQSFPSPSVSKKEKMIIHAIRFPRTSSDTVMDFLNENKLAPAPIGMTIDFILQYPDIAKNEIVVTLTVAKGSLFGGEKFVPVIQKELSPNPKRKISGNGLELMLDFWKGSWRPGTIFLAVEKQIQIDSIGLINYTDAALGNFQCNLDKKFLKKFDFKISPSQKGRTAQVFLVKSSFPLSQTELMKLVKEDHKTLKPGNALDLLLVKQQIDGIGEPIIAMGLMPGQQINGHVPVWIPEPCSFEMMKSVPEWGSEVMILFITPPKSAKKK